MAEEIESSKNKQKMLDPMNPYGEPFDEALSEACEYPYPGKGKKKKKR